MLQRMEEDVRSLVGRLSYKQEAGGLRVGPPCPRDSTSPGSVDRSAGVAMGIKRAAGRAYGQEALREPSARGHGPTSGRVALRLGQTEDVFRREYLPTSPRLRSGEGRPDAVREGSP